MIAFFFLLQDLIKDYALHLNSHNFTYLPICDNSCFSLSFMTLTLGVVLVSYFCRMPLNLGFCFLMIILRFCFIAKDTTDMICPSQCFKVGDI